MKFNINDYKGKYVMHCKTEEEAKDFCNYLDSIGKTWCNGQRYTFNNRYESYFSETCYKFNDGHYSSREFYKDKYIILEWSNFMTKNFTKADLRSGDVVLRRNGNVEIFCKEAGSFISKTGYDRLSDLNMNLKMKENKGSWYDIIAVRRPNYDFECQFKAFDEKYGDLVYEEVEEMTMEEICKALGKNIKIVKEK